MYGIILLLPLIIIRYGVLSMMGKEALGRAGFFPPTQGFEKIAYWVYEITTLALMVYLIFLKISIVGVISYIGLGIFIIGMLMYNFSTIQFARPNKNGINMSGLYRISRNPMYAAFFLYFLGCAILTYSWILLFILIVLQISVHFLILSEERWCINEFGEEYKEYIRRVRRYL